MVEKLTRRQRVEIVSVMSEIMDRSQTATDEFVDIGGSELENLLSALGKRCYEGFELDILRSEPALSIGRRELFTGSRTTRSLIKKARTVSDHFVFVSQMRRQMIWASIEEGLR